MTKEREEERGSKRQGSEIADQARVHIGFILQVPSNCGQMLTVTLTTIEEKSRG